MNWYYAKDGQQAGPIDDTQLASLVAAGTIRGETLVWKEGMAQWQPYQQVWTDGMPDWRQAGTAPARIPAAPPIIDPPGWQTAAPDDLVKAAAQRPPLSATKCLSDGWTILKANFGTLIGAVAVGYLCMMAAGIIPIVGGCIGLLVNAPIMAGIWLVYIRTVRTEDPGIGDVFAGFSKAWMPLVGTGLLTGLISALPLIPFIGGVVFYLITHPNQGPPQGVELAVGIALFLLCLPFCIYLSIAFFFALPLVLDRGMGVFDAMSASRRVVNRHFLGILSLGLLTMLVCIAGLLALCVGLVVAVPLTLAAWAVAYEELLGSRVTLQPPPEAPSTPANP